MTARDVILEMIRLIDAGWCQGSGARDAGGRGTPTHGPYATSFCIHRARGRVLGAELHRLDYAVSHALSMAFNGCGEASMMDYNDAPGRTKEEVPDKLRDALDFCAKDGIPHV